MKTSMLRNILECGRVLWNRHGSDILTATACAGVAVTGYLSVKAYKDAEPVVEEEKRNVKYDMNITDEGEAIIAPAEFTLEDYWRVSWRYYIPAVISGVTTIGLIVKGHNIDKKKLASLGTAYAILNTKYKEYQHELYERNPELHDEIKKKIRLDHSSTDRIYTARNVGYNDRNEDKILFYDTYSGRRYEMPLSRLYKAENMLNKKYLFSGEATPNDFYRYLGWDTTPYGDSVGWSSYNGSPLWITVRDDEIEVLDDGLEYRIIDFEFDPSEKYFDIPERIGHMFDVR